jgi:hypothetical protein
MKMDYDTAHTLNALAEDLRAVAEKPDQYELDPQTHLALLSAAENLQQLLAKVTHITS